MAIIPDFKPTGGNHQPATPSLMAAMAPGKALAGLGQDIAGAAELGLETAIKYKEGKEVAAMHESRLAMEQVLAKHDEFRAKNPDNETEWESDITAGIDSLRTDFLKRPGLSPEQRAKFTEQFNNWKAEYGTKARTDALIHGRKRARNTTSQLVYSYRRAGKFDDARRTIEEAAPNFSDGERAADLQDIDFDEQQQAKRDMAARYQFAAEDDPVEVIKILSAKGDNGFLNDPEMEDGTRLRLIKDAERGLAKKKADEFQTLKDAIDRGELTATELEHDPIYLDAAEKKSLSIYLKRHTPPTDEEDRKAWREIENVRDAYTAAKSGTMDEVAYRNAHRDAHMKILELIPQGYSGPLMETLNRFSPARIYDMKATAPPTREDVKTDISIEVRSTLEAAFKAGFFGNVAEDTPPMEMEKAARKRRDLQNKALDWIATQKEITPEAARAYTDSLLSGDRAKSTVRDFQSFIPGSAQRLRLAAAMPPLPPKQGAKDKATADPLQIPPGDGSASDALLPARQLESFLNPTKP